MESGNSKNAKLKFFLESYDYSYWHYKMITLSKVLGDEEFISKISKEFKEGGEPEKIKRGLQTEIYFISFHMMETLFALIGAFTYQPEDPWAWMNEYKSSKLNKLIQSIREGEFESLYESLGLNDTEEYLRYLFFSVPTAETTKEWERKIGTVIGPTKECLRLLAGEYFDKRDVFNAYKHGLIAMTGKVKFELVDNKGRLRDSSPEFPVMMHLPKGGRKSKSLPKNDKIEFHTIFEPALDFTPLNYRAQQKISRMTFDLIRNLVNVRRPSVLKAGGVSVFPIKDVDEMRKVFEESRAPLLRIDMA